MRIPRFALALMIVAIAMLSAGLMLVRAREAAPWWFEFSIRFPNGNNVLIDQNSAQLEAKPLESIQRMPDGYLAYVIRLVESKDGAVEIGIRAQKFSSTLDWHTALKQVRNASEQVNWYVPGERVRVPVQGYELVEITGVCLTEPPQHTPGSETYLPKNGELRLSSPVLLRDGRLVADMNGATTYASPGYVAAFYAPGEGIFLFSLNSFDGAAEATLENSQLDFKSDGQSYQVLTGTPIVSGEQNSRKIWVAHTKKTFKMGDHGKRETWAVWSMNTSKASEYLQK